MQQTQQILLSVKHKLPEPNSILPSELIRSQPARHIRKRVLDINSLSSYDWPLDQCNQTARDKSSSILNSYYGPKFDINELLKFRNKIVFLNSMVQPKEYQNKDFYFGSITTSITKPRKSLCTPFVHQQTYQLQFDDRIQSGNLYFALQHESRVYLLANRLDYNTRSYGQWFYFKAKNVTDKNGIFRFHIVNMTKNGAMFGKGLKVSVCRRGIWSKQGSQICYVQNRFLRNVPTEKQLNRYGLKNLETYNTLSFSLQISSRQTIYIAYNQPYTYTRLGRKLDIIMNQHANVSRSILCRTPLGNRVQMITINKLSNIEEKKIIFITARAHPVETPSSFVVQGIIDEILKPSQPHLVDQLLQKYLIKIVPMINPDGVIVGNSRCNIHGYDLNRQWKDPEKGNVPQIVSLKKAILKYQGKIQMFIDLHGHSTKKNVFAYGCHDIRNPVASRQFPFLLSKLSQRNFSYSSCRFSLLGEAKNQNKDGTARVSLWKKLKIPNIFTIQNSYCSAQGSSFHYDSKSYGNIGKQIVRTLCQFFRREAQSTNSEYNIFFEKSSKTKQALLDQLRNNSQLINGNIRQNQQISSESEEQDRVFPEKTDPQSPQKLQRNLSTKIRLKSKVEGSNKEIKQIKVLQKNITLEPGIKNDNPLIYSSENLQNNLRKKHLRNLSPLIKQTSPTNQKKVNLFEFKSQNHKMIATERGQSLSNLTKYKNVSMRKTNALSIIQIGLEDTLAQQQSNNNNRQITKTISAKNINNQMVGIHHRMIKCNTNNNQVKLTTNYAQNILQFPDNDAFTDIHYRQPVLKIKKNLSRNTNKLQDYISKINTLQSSKHLPVNGSTRRNNNSTNNDMNISISNK